MPGNIVHFELQAADADRAQLEAKRVEVEAALNELGDEADRSVKG